MSAYTVKAYGPPGTGKTHTATEWISRQVENQGAAKDRVAFVSFTNAACDEARRRLQARLDLYDYETNFCATVHALCKRALHIEGRDWLAEGKALREFGADYGYSLVPSRKSADGDLEEVVKSGGEDALLLSAWNFGRARLITDPIACFNCFCDYDPNAGLRVPREKFLKFVGEYEAWKRLLATRRYDYTDLCLELLKYPRVLPVDVVVVDEAQDMPPLLWAVVKALFADTPLKACLADPDQAIYSYQGAVPELFNEQEAEKVFGLKQSRRLPSRIAAHASRLISQNRNRVPTEFRPVTAPIIEGRQDREPGEARQIELEGDLQSVRRVSELDLLNGESWFLLVRNWAFCGQITEQLEEMGVPYRIQGEAQYSPWSPKGPLKAVQTIFRLSTPGEKIGADELSVLVDKTRVETRQQPGCWVYGSKSKIAQFLEQNPASTFSLVDLPHLGLTEWGFDRLALRDLSILSGGISDRDLGAYKTAQAKGTFGQEIRVTVSTIHGVKGQEADNVAALQICSRAPYLNLDRADRYEEEVRLAYVAITRAKLRFFGIEGDGGGYPYQVFGL